MQRARASCSSRRRPCRTGRCSASCRRAAAPSPCRSTRWRASTRRGSSSSPGAAWTSLRCSIRRACSRSSSRRAWRAQRACRHCSAAAAARALLRLQAPSARPQLPPPPATSAPHARLLFTHLQVPRAVGAQVKPPPAATPSRAARAWLEVTAHTLYSLPAPTLPAFLLCVTPLSAFNHPMRLRRGRGSATAAGPRTARAASGCASRRRRRCCAR